MCNTYAHIHVFYFGTVFVFIHLFSEHVQFKDKAVTHCISEKKRRRTTEGNLWISDVPFLGFFPGDFYEEEIWVNEEGL